MAKTETTLQLEKDIWIATHKQSVFGCYEVTIGWFGRERVNYMTYDTNGVWRCYEVKISKSDFHSKAKNTFIGHFNYYVMTKELYELVKGEIPSHIGVYIGQSSVKRAKRQPLKEDEQTLKNSMIRSLYREVEKQIRSNSPTLIEQITRQSKQFERQMEDYRNKYWELMRIGREKFGDRWNEEIDL